eukprot:CAMPEP_0204848004 /NCGR_PEP_ID=MMETSP1347-20130617/3216_1 /ASSEMBLY_ACC=CAM_ASM_000690 /TAXON_ID=215587 /ORGANISM="Aplanochytrium stocchinoi, Strain GSBS06" /LENGTH=372 /DNA_ID=CAMNT_0051989267 /DNA_START=86 /DNA_END=1204 /DNA_ORIENTATION=+
MSSVPYAEPVLEDDNPFAYPNPEPSAPSLQHQNQPQVHRFNTSPAYNIQTQNVNTNSSRVRVRIHQSTPNHSYSYSHDSEGIHRRRQNSYELDIQDQHVVVHLNPRSGGNGTGAYRGLGGTYEPSSEYPENKITQDWLFEGRLLRVKGTEKNLILKEVKCRMDSMNSGDVFILDTALNLYVWNGKDSSPIEREKALVFASSVIKARSGKTKLIVLNEGANDECTQFWNKIQGKKKVMGMVVKRYSIKTEEEGGSDEKHNAFRKKMYRLTDRSGDLKFTLCTKGNMDKNNMVSWRKLDSGDVFVLDDGFKIWVWVGKGTSLREREMCLTYSAKYVKRYNRPTSLPIQKIEEGKEPPEFIENFGHFSEKNCVIS